LETDSPPASRRTRRRPAIEVDLNDIEGTRALRDALPARDTFDPNYRRLRYCRSADDFLIGIIDSKLDAHEVMAQVRDFLTNRLKLQMSVEKMTDRLPVPFGTTLIDDPDVCSAR
jgi:hypothetical protein